LGFVSVLFIWVFVSNFLPGLRAGFLVDEITVVSFCVVRKRRLEVSWWWLGDPPVEGRLIFIFEMFW